VIFVKVGFREGYPEISPRSAMFSRITELGGFVEGISSEVHPAIAIRPGDVVVTKRRVSAFAGSDLDVVLRAGGIEALVLTGIATSGVVLSTLRQAADLDFSLMVLSDGCSDADDEVHRVLCEKVFPRQAQVLTVAAWVNALALQGDARLASCRLSQLGRPMQEPADQSARRSLSHEGSSRSAVSERGSTPRVSRPPPQWALRITVPRFGRSVARVDLIVALLVILIVLALVGSIAVSPLLWVLVIILVLFFAVRGRGRYYGRRG
jgi:hypothetical protein